CSSWFLQELPLAGDEAVEPGEVGVDRGHVPLQQGAAVGVERAAAAALSSVLSATADELRTALLEQVEPLRRAQVGRERDPEVEGAVVADVGVGERLDEAFPPDV